ncbi:hypothetical protein [Acinetobacter lwoffii]|uniref:hypothetical protein n=1 Tax=Acinetobacter lwoffii TaxID=28090 RepID=UPI003008DBBF
MTLKGFARISLARQIGCLSVPGCHVHHSAVYLQRHVQGIRSHSRQFSNYSITRSRHKQRHSIL